MITTFAKLYHDHQNQPPLLQHQSEDLQVFVYLLKILKFLNHNHLIPSQPKHMEPESSNPAGGTVIIVYVITFPAPFRIESSNSLLPHFLQKYTVARCSSSHFVHFLASTLPAFAASINSGFADNLHTLKDMNCTTGASSTKVLR